VSELEPPVSVIVTSHGRGRLLPRLLEALLSQKPQPLEIIVVVDEPAPGLLESLPESERIRLIVRPKRMGKVSALNEALSVSHGTAIVFLDDDVEVRDPGFIGKVAAALEEADIVDIKKVVAGRGLLSGLVYVEYLGFNLASMLLARVAGRSPAVNGAAFAARRRLVEALGGFSPVVYEDLDFATRAFLLGARYGYLGETCVLNQAPGSWREWYRQRKRWGLGAALWIRDYFRPLLHAFLEFPHVAAASLVTALPSLATTVLVMLVDKGYAVKLAYLALLLASTTMTQLLPVASLISINLHVAALAARAALLAAITALLSIPYLVAARVLGVKSRMLLYPVYFFVYQPLWFTMLLGGMFRAYLLGVEEAEDWVVPRRYK